MTMQITTEKTLDGHPIVHGMRVWDYDLRPGYIDLGGCNDRDWQKCCCGRCPAINGERRTLWFKVTTDQPPSTDEIEAIIASGGYYYPRGSLMNSERVWVIHPFDKVPA